MKKSKQQSQKLSLKKASIILLTQTQLEQFHGGNDTNRPPPTNSCKTCGSARETCPQ